MAIRRFDPDEQEFLKAVGLEPDDLEMLVEADPAVPAAVQARIRAMTRRKVGLAAEGQPADRSRAPRPWLRRWLPAAAAVLLLAGASLTVAGSPTVKAALQGLVRLVPGFGIVETQRETVVLVEPVKAAGPRGTLTVAALMSTGEYTELRFQIDGLPAVKPDPDTMDHNPVRAALVLPDGSRLKQTSAQTGAGLGNVRGTVWFPALPPGTRSVTLELPEMLSLTDPYTVALNLVDAAAAGLKEAGAGGWSAPHNGVTLGAPYMAVTQERITLLLEAALPEQGARVSRVGGEGRRPVLIDNLGNSYPLVPEESALGSSSHGLSAAFTGPVRAGATSLRLTVGAVQVEAPGEARLRVPLSRLPLGGSAALNKQLQLGEHTILVRSVTRVANDRFALDLDLGPEQNGAVLQYVFIQPYRASGGSHFRFDPATDKQASDFGVSYSPDGGYLDLVFSRPTLEIQGPWQIDLPVK